MIYHEKTAKVLIQEQERWFNMKRLQSLDSSSSEVLIQKNDGISQKDSKSLAQEQERWRWYIMRRLQKSWFKNKNDDDDISWEDCKSLDQKQERWYLIKIQYCRSLDSRKERWYLIKRQQKSCSRTRTMKNLLLNIPTGCPTKGILNPPKRMPKYQGTHKNLNHSKRLYKKDHSGCLFILNANEVLYWQSPSCPGL